MPIASDMLQVLVHNTIAALTTAKQMKGVWLDALRGYRAEAERERDDGAVVLMESVSRLMAGEDPDVIAPQLSGDYARCWTDIIGGLRGDSQPRSTIAVVMAFLNAENEEQRQQVIREHAEILFSGEAETLFEEVAQQYRGDPKMSGLISSHRLLLQRCRQEGIDEVLAAAPPPASSTVKSPGS